MGERDRYRAMIDGANSEGWLLYRVPDGPFGGKRPWDIGGSTPGGTAVGLEVKVVRKALDPRTDPVPWGLFSEHQVTWLRLLVVRGGCTLVALISPGGGISVFRIGSTANMHLPLRNHRCANLEPTRGGFLVGWGPLLVDGR